MSVKGRFTPGEIMIAGNVGVLRTVSAVAKSRPNAHGARTDEINKHIIGALGELAIAKYLNCHWTPLANGPLKLIPGDVGVGVQVRAADRKSGSLITHPDDPDEHVFYFVLINLPSYEIVGWLRGTEAKRREYWRDDEKVREAAFFAPQRVLHAPPHTASAA